MRQDVIARQVRAMKDAGLDAIVSISPENFAYVTGFLSPTAPIMRWRHAMALVTADGKVALVVGGHGGEYDPGEVTGREQTSPFGASSNSMP